MARWAGSACVAVRTYSVRPAGCRKVAGERQPVVELGERDLAAGGAALDDAAFLLGPLREAAHHQRTGRHPQRLESARNSH